MAKKPPRVFPIVDLNLHVAGGDYLVSARATDTFTVFGQEWVCLFEITGISRDGWDGKGDFKEIAEMIYSDPDLSAVVCDKLSWKMSGREN